MSTPPAGAGGPAAVARLSRILEALTTPDTAVVRAAERELRAATAAPAAVLPLATIACSAPVAHTRQLAAVLLRRAVRAHWAELPPPDRAALKGALLARLPVEDAAAPRRGLATAAAAVCRAEGALWTELTLTAVAMSRAPEPFVRVGAFKVFDAVADSVPGRLAPHAPTVCVLIGTGLGDADPAVRLAALDAYATCANAVSVYAESEEPWAAIGSLVPAVATVARAAAQTVVAAAESGVGSTDGVDEDDFARLLCVVFDVFAMLSDSAGGAVMRPHFADTFRFAVEIAVPPGVPHAARQAAVEYICSALHSKPRTLRKAGLAKLALFMALRMALMHRRAGAAAGAGAGAGGNGDHIVDDDSVDDDEDSEVNGFDLALRIIYTVASRAELSRFTFNEVMGIVPRLLAGDVALFDLSRPPPSPHHATAVAYRVIGAIAEGCSRDVSTHAEDILGQLAGGAVDPAAPARTRAYAMESIACVLSALDVTEMEDVGRARIGQTCLQAVLTAMRDPVLFVKRSACIALEPTLELFDDDGQVLRERVAEVLGALESLGPAAAIEAVSVAAVIAENVGTDFVASDAYRGVVDGMVQLMSRSAEADLGARAAATQSASIVVASCRDWSAAERLATQAIQGFGIDDAGLAEATYAFFSKMAQTHGGRVAFAYGRRVLTKALESCNREDVVFTRDADDASGMFAAGSGDGDEAEDGEEGGGLGSFGVRTALLDEKAMATYAIGSMATAVATKEFFDLASSPSADAASNATAILGLLLSAGECLDPMATYFHEEIRSAGIRADVAYAVAAARAPAISPQLAFGPKDATNRTVGRLVHTLQEDEDVFVVTVALHACATFCTQVAPGVLAQFKDVLIQAIEVLIQGRATCQVAGEDGDEEEEDGGGGGRGAPDGGDDEQLDGGDERGTLIDGICEALSALARAMRGHFAADWAKLLPQVTEKLITPAALPRNCAIVVGMFADVFLFLNWDRCEAFDPPAPGSPDALAPQNAVDGLAAHVFPLAMQGASGKGGASRTLRRNSVFLLGVLFGATRPSTAGVWSQLKAALQLFEMIVNQGKEVDGALVDNAVGAVARIISKDGLPAGALGSTRNALHLVLSAVPIEDDPTENASVARAVVAVAAGGDVGALEMMADAVVSCLASAVLLSVEQEEREAEGLPAPQEEDLNDYMARLDAAERHQMVQVMREVRSKCGDSCFTRLQLGPEDQARLSALLSA